jgi:hypothetical protein
LDEKERSMINDEQRVSIGNTDQAAGLRTLFGLARPKVMMLSSALSAANSTELGLGTAHALKGLGFKVLLIDEIPMSERHTTNSIPYPIQYDLGQAMANLVPLSKSIRQVDENLWFAMSSRIALHQKNRQFKSTPLDMRLGPAGLALDYVIVVTNKPLHAVIPLYSHQVNHIMVTGIDEASSIKSISMMRELVLHGPIQAIPVCIIGGEQAHEGQTAFERLSAMSKSYLEQSIKLQSWVDAKTSRQLFGSGSEKDSDLILSARAFDQITKYIIK